MIPIKSMWTGAVSVSKLQLPIKLGTTTQDNALGLHMVRASDGSRIRFTRVAEADGQEVEWNDIAKGYTAPDGSMVILDKDDFEKAYGPKNRVASLLMFTDPSNVPPMASKTFYYVAPDRGGEGAYALLAGALKSSGKVAILTFAMRQREAMAVLREHDGYLLLQSLEWDADVLKPDFAAPPQSATDAEREMALKLVEAMSGDFRHADYTDKSTEAVLSVIQSKMETSQVIQPPARPEQASGGAQLGDLMSQLASSIEEHKKEAPKKAAAGRKSA